MNKKTKLNIFWFVLIIIGVSLGLASFYQQGQIKQTGNFESDAKKLGFESKVTKANEKELRVETIASDPSLVALGKKFPKIAGFNKAKNYLILFQNSHELRPTGGYIGSFAVLTVKDGTIKEFNFYDTSNFDYRNNDKGGLKKTPTPFQKYPDIYWWGLRDSNWDPNFPNTAKRVARFYENLGGKKDIDGTVAITPKVLKRALRITGPVKVEGEDEFRAENVVDRIQYRVEKGFLDKEGGRERRKEIMEELARKIISKTKSWNPLSYPELLSTVKEAARKKEIQVYFENESLQSFFSDYAWTGELKPVQQDFLMIVDANLGALKTDRVVKRSIKYELDLSDKDRRPWARLEIEYKNNGQKKDWRTTDYQSYTRLYLPQTINLVGTKGFASNPKIEKKADKKVLAGWIGVPLGETRKVVVEYRLPKKIRKDNYSLTVQKQAGVDGVPTKLKYYLSEKNIERNLSLREDLKISF